LRFTSEDAVIGAGTAPEIQRGTSQSKGAAPPRCFCSVTCVGSMISSGTGDTLVSGDGLARYH
jgi:hypothetical protein